MNEQCAFDRCTITYTYYIQSIQSNSLDAESLTDKCVQRSNMKAWTTFLTNISVVVVGMRCVWDSCLLTLFLW